MFFSTTCISFFLFCLTVYLGHLLTRGKAETFFSLRFTYALERQRRGGKKERNVLGHSLHGCNNRSWARLKSGIVGGQHRLKHLSQPPPFARHISRTRIRTGAAGTPVGTAGQAAGILDDGVPCCTRLAPSLAPAE